MKVLIINYRFFVSGGPERYMFNVMELLEKNGHQVVPFSIKSRRNEKTEFEDYFADPVGGQDVAYFHEGNQSIRFAISTVTRLFYSFHVRRKLSKLIKDEKPDVAYILHHYNKLSPSVISACKSHGVRVVLRLSDFFLLCPQAHFLRNGKICEECHKKSLFSCVKYKCVKNSRVGSLLKATALYFQKYVFKVYGSVDKFVCTTNFMRQKLIQDNVDEKRICVVKTFIKEIGGRDENIDRNYILYFGRFCYEKGVDLLVNAYIDSRLYESGVRLILVGGKASEISGVSEEALENMSQHITICDFLPIEKLEPLVKECLYTVVPSRWYENLPNTILESYKFSKPVVASNVGSLPESVIDGETGLLFENENIPDLSRKLKELVVDKEKRVCMQSNIKLTVSTYSQDTHYKSLVDVLSGEL